jgi:DNA polymerase III subunit gamma/tau
VSYQVLARKYRPQVFADMVGQEHLVKVLTNAIASGRVAHAYLFSGPRGVGKTTAARILAKALNCEKGPTPTPCDQCTSCVEIRTGRSMDVLEIDGASNRGINEVRELRENVRFAAAGGRSKVYIIDEVHMLTQEAFNALLKTLEEPPSHVVFVFATTEPFKLPATILSRCQRFDFARIPSRKIAEHLAGVLDKENASLGEAGKPPFQAAPEALALIARRAEGGLRDALSLLDQVTAAVEGPIDRTAVEAFLGLVGEEFYAGLVERLAEGDTAGALQLLDDTYRRGADLRDLADGLALALRDLLLLRIGDDLAPLLDAPESDLVRLKAQAQAFSRDTLMELVDRAAELVPELRRSETPRLSMELALAEMAEMSRRMPLGEVVERLLDLERRLGGEAGAPTPPRAAPRSRAQPPAASGPESRSSLLASSAEGFWTLCLDAARAKSLPLGAKLAQALPVSFDPGTHLVLAPAAPSGRGLLQDCLSDPETQAFLTDFVTAQGLPKLRVMLQADAASAAGKPREERPGGLAASTPVPRTSAAKTATTVPAAATPTPKAETGAPATVTSPPPPPAVEDKRTMGQLFQDEPMLQKALDMFDGEVIP